MNLPTRFHYKWPRLSSLHYGLEDDVVEYPEKHMRFDDDVSSTTDNSVYGRAAKGYTMYCPSSERSEISYLGKNENESGSDTVSSQYIQRRHTCRVVLVVFMILSLLGVVVAAIVMAVLSNKIPSFIPEGTFVSSIRLLDRNYTPGLSNRTSDEFSATQDEFCSELVKILKRPNSPVDSAGIQCTVLEFRNGSLIIRYQVNIRTRRFWFKDLANSLNEYLITEQKSGYLGNLKVDTNHLCLLVDSIMVDLSSSNICHLIKDTIEKAKSTTVLETSTKIGSSSTLSADTRSVTSSTPITQNMTTITAEHSGSLIKYLSSSPIYTSSTKLLVFDSSETPVTKKDWFDVTATVSTYLTEETSSALLPDVTRTSEIISTSSSSVLRESTIVPDQEVIYTSVVKDDSSTKISVSFSEELKQTTERLYKSAITSSSDFISVSSHNIFQTTRTIDSTSDKTDVFSGSNAISEEKISKTNNLASDNTPFLTKSFSHTNPLQTEYYTSTNDLQNAYEITSPLNVLSTSLSNNDFSLPSSELTTAITGIVNTTSERAQTMSGKISKTDEISPLSEPTQIYTSQHTSMSGNKATQTDSQMNIGSTLFTVPLSTVTLESGIISSFNRPNYSTPSADVERITVISSLTSSSLFYLQSSVNVDDYVTSLKLPTSTTFPKVSLETSLTSLEGSISLKKHTDLAQLQTLVSEEQLKTTEKQTAVARTVKDISISSNTVGSADYQRSSAIFTDFALSSFPFTTESVDFQKETSFTEIIVPSSTVKMINSDNPRFAFSSSRVNSVDETGSP